jgi:hypothetical protein
MQCRIIAIMMVLLCGVLTFAGCTGIPSTPGSATPGSGTPAGSGTPGSGALIPFTTVPTDVLPDYNDVTIDVLEKDYLGIIPVIFQGGKGMNSVKKVDIKLTRADGTTETATVGTKKGDEVELQGTRGSGSARGPIDRVEVWVSVNTGQTYKVVDVLREYRSRG